MELMDKEERRRRIQQLKKELKREAKLKKLQYRRKTLKEKRLEKSSLSKSQSSFDRSYVRRTVLLMNNRALAKSLEKCKIEIRYLMKENQALRAQSFNLEFEKNKNRALLNNIKMFVNLLKEKYTEVVNIIEDTSIFNFTYDECNTGIFSRLSMAENKPCREQGPCNGEPDNCENSPWFIQPVVEGPLRESKKMPFDLSAVMEASNLLGSSIAYEEASSEEESLSEEEPCVADEKCDMSINRRATFVVKESQQTMDLPTPVRSIRGRLRRSTMIPSMISCGDEGKEVMPESPQESNLKSTELRDIKLPINIINNNALDLVSLNLEHKVKDLDMSPEFTTKFKDTYSPNQETKARRVTFHASLSKASSKDTPDTSSPEMEPELENLKRATKSNSATTSRRSTKVDKSEELLPRPRRQSRTAPKVYKEPPLNKKLRRP